MTARQIGDIVEMAYLYRTQKKDGVFHPRWRFQYRDWQGRKRKGTGYTSKAETEKLAAKIEAEQSAIRNGHVPRPKPVDKSFQEASEAYLSWGEMQGGRGGRPWGPEHARKRKRQLKWWWEKLDLKYVSDLVGSLGRIEEALQELNEAELAGKTLSNYAETIVAFCAWCVARQLLEENPLKNLAPIDTTPREQRRAMTPEEIKRRAVLLEPRQPLAVRQPFLGLQEQPASL